MKLYCSNSGGHRPPPLGGDACPHATHGGSVLALSIVAGDGLDWLIDDFATVWHILYYVEMPNPVVHFEIGCRDTARAQQLYRDLFDWKIEAAGPAAMISEAGIGGHITALGHEPFHYTIFYVEVADVAAHIVKAEGLGCKKLVGPIKLPTGTFAWIADPDGNTIGLWKTAA